MRVYGSDRASCGNTHANTEANTSKLAQPVRGEQANLMLLNVILGLRRRLAREVQRGHINVETDGYSETASIARLAVHRGVIPIHSTRYHTE